NAPQLRWATATIGVGTLERYEFAAESPEAGREGIVEVWAAKADRLGDVRYEVILNGTVIGTQTVTGARVERQSFTYDGSLLRSGTNVLVLRNPPNEAGERFSELNFIQAEVTAP